MKVYFGFDDTDTLEAPYGTGKLVRWFQKGMPDGCECLGVVRQQLFMCDAIPYTSHNSAACLIAGIQDPSQLDKAIEAAVAHIRVHALEGSDPGLCVATESDAASNGLIEFGHFCTRAVSTQSEAMKAAGKVHLSGHGGTNEGIIGAAAAVGLTASGWSGRFIEYQNLRNWSEAVSVGELRGAGIEVVSVDRDAALPAPHETVLTNRWLRPRLIGHRPVLFVSPKGAGLWENLYHKRKKGRINSKLTDTAQ